MELHLASVRRGASQIRGAGLVSIVERAGSDRGLAAVREGRRVRIRIVRVVLQGEAREGARETVGDARERDGTGGRDVRARIELGEVDAAVRAERAGQHIDADAARRPIGIVAGQRVGAGRDVARAKTAVLRVKREVEDVRALEQTVEVHLVIGGGGTRAGRRMIFRERVRRAESARGRVGRRSFARHGSRTRARTRTRTRAVARVDRRDGVLVVAAAAREERNNEEGSNGKLLHWMPTYSGERPRRKHSFPSTNFVTQRRWTAENQKVREP